ncbi:MAG TPA: hypothetical protein VNF29_14935 [Candidatus Binataceae bacterium]|nr:hypothetical protein [Candidatus Binataceae bacterium]
MRRPHKAVAAHAVGNHRRFPARGRMLALLPLPCPDPAQAAAGAALRPHAHHCAACGAIYRCAGAGDTGLCVPLCAPCYSLELGRQLSAYRTMVAAAPERKSRQLVKGRGRALCAGARRLARHSLPRPSHARSNHEETSADNAISKGAPVGDKNLSRTAAPGARLIPIGMIQPWT